MKKQFINKSELFNINNYNASAQINILKNRNPQFIKYCVEQGVAGYFYTLAKNKKLKLSSDIQQDLKPFYLKIYLENLVKKEAQNELLNLFSSNGIDCIVLKGFSLIDIIYNDLGARPFGDLDFLIHYKKIDLAIELLNSIGYHQCIQKKLPKVHHHLSPFLKNNIIVEVHQHPYLLNDSNNSVINYLWTRKIKANTGNYFILHPEDYFIYLCLHLISHLKIGQGRLCHFYDIVNFLWLYNENLNQKNLLSLTKQLNRENDFKLIQSLLTKYFYIPENQKVNYQKKGDLYIQVVLPNNINSISIIKLRKTYHKFLSQRGFLRKVFYIFILLKPKNNESFLANFIQKIYLLFIRIRALITYKILNN